MNVGTKELKNRLSHYLRMVRDGERIVVCDRGKVVAEIRRAADPADEDDASVMRELARKGIVTLGRGRLKDFVPVRPRRRASLSAIILEDRG